MPSSYSDIATLIPGLNQLWDQTLGDPSIKIAILDGPVDNTHPALSSAKLVIQKNQLSNKNGNTGAAARHGTHVTSIIFGHHGSGIKGISPLCQGLIFPVFSDSEKGGIMPCSQIELARIILQAAAAGAKIINISAGEFSPTGTSHPILSRAINHCTEQGILIVAAAGNDGCECLHIPGSLPSVLAVGAMDEKGKPLEFSNWGKTYHTQGILAPGKGITGADAGNGITQKTGTSFATPIVSGIAALLMSLQKKHGRTPNAMEVKEILLESALGCDDLHEIECKRLLKGRINLSGAYSIFQQKINNMEESTHNQNLSSQEKPVPEASFTEENRVKASTQTLAPSEMKTASEESVNPFIEPSIPEQKSKEKGIHLSACTCRQHEKCGCGAISSQLVYAIGKLGFDFGSEARRDSIAQHMGEGSPNDPENLLEYLEANPWDADSIIWTLHHDSIPIYAIRPMGAFIAEGYGRIRSFLNDQITAGAELVSVPGVTVGRVELISGEVVPVIKPDLRCMYNWNVEALLKAVVKESNSKLKAEVSNFLQRIYHEFRNLGITPQERAINYTGTNALTVSGIFEETLKDKVQLDTIEVEPSPLCRIGSDCWDVLLTFFDPENQLTRARKVYRFTVDVSDICPVMVGPVRSWYIR